jgi:hypothetical protein
LSSRRWLPELEAMVLIIVDIIQYYHALLKA